MFLIGVDGLKNISLICRRRQNRSVEQEREILTPFLARARKGGILVVWQIKAELEAAIGRSMARSSVYQLLPVWLAQAGTGQTAYTARSVSVGGKLTEALAQLIAGWPDRPRSG